MVMEASPSPQSVGREFVRQYYTLLNKAPAHLHRFYNNHSSFVHGGLDAPNRETNPAIGQKQIHQKIQQLNFRDCHAKISQVDSQATLGNGVVVQVTGELSNAGQPMRRFTQTFVLAAQAPKKYYVHNDIFRYQDLGFPDEEEGDVESGDAGIGDSVGEREPEEGVRSEPEEDEQSNQGHQLPPATAPPEPQGPPSLIPTQQPPLQQHVYYAPPPQQPVHPVMQPVAINGSVHDESHLINQQQHAHTYISEPATQEQFVQEPEPEVVPEQQQQQVEQEPQVPIEESQEQQEVELEQHSISESQPEAPVPIPAANNSGPKTYATSVKSFATAATGSISPQAPKQSMSPPPAPHQRLDDRMPAPVVNSGPILSSPSSVSSSQQQAHRGIGGNQQQQQQQQQPQQQRASRGGPVQRGMGRGPPRPPFPSDDNGWDGDRRGGRQGQYGDSHQLFLGNLPLDASEDQLRQLFEQYGPVAELRVHSKQNERGKAPHGTSNTNRVPNYGFITFEDHQSVVNVLSNLPIHFPDENHTKLNVEEKKVRPRMSMEGGGGRTSSGDGSVRPMGGQQQRGPGGGPGGVMRGSGQPGTRGGRTSYPRGGDGGRTGGMRQPGNHNYQSRR